MSEQKRFSVDLGAVAKGETKRMRLMRKAELQSVNYPNEVWAMDRTAAARIIERFKTHGVATHLDYEHQSEPEFNHRPDGLAPASGWIEDFEWVEKDSDEDGLYIHVRWTDEAKELIGKDQYRYLSPVTLHNKSNQIVGIKSVALVNQPAIHGMDRVAASDRRGSETDNAKEKSMDVSKLIGEITTLAGCEVAGTASDEVKLNAIRDFVTKAKAPPPEREAVNSVRKALDLKESATGAELVVAINSLKKSGGETGELQTKLNAVTNELAEMRAERLLEPYIKANKINPNDEADLKMCRRLAKEDPEALKHHMERRKPYVEPGRTSDPGPGTTDGSAKEEEMIEESVKAHKGDPLAGIAALQTKLKQPYLDQGLTHKAANRACADRYPKIFAAV